MRLSDYNVSLSGMNAAQIATMVAQQNISNINTAGYVRQNVNQQALYGDGGLLQGKQTGYGVKVTDIARVTSGALNLQYNQQIAKQSAAAYGSGALGQAMNLFGTLGTNTPSDYLDNFFTSWGALAKNPDQQTNATALLSDMNLFEGQLNQLKLGLDDLQHTISTDIRASVTGLNDLISKFGKLNQAIGNAGSNPPNDLLNERDSLLAQMSAYAKVSTTTHPNNPEVYDITIGGRLVVQGSKTNQIQMTAQNGSYQFSVDGNQLDLPEGQLRAAVDVGGKEIKDYQTKLNTFMDGLVDGTNQAQLNSFNNQIDQIAKINLQLQADPANETLIKNRDEAVRQLAKFPGVTVDSTNGTLSYDGNTFTIAAIDTNAKASDISQFSIRIFSKNPDGSLQLNPILTKDNSSQGFLGAIADQMSALKNTPTIGNATLSDFMDGLITTVATDSSGANAIAKAENQTLDNLSNAKSSVEGVNIDEEMTNIMQYQSYYVANTKAMNIVNDMFQSLLNIM